jgi:arginine decarboxylase
MYNPENSEKDHGSFWICLVDRMCDIVSSPAAGAPTISHINLSIFKSISDYWAIGQLFPVMPIHGFNERPTVRVVQSDLTCKNDGKVDTFISSGSLALES